MPENVKLRTQNTHFCILSFYPFFPLLLCFFNSYTFIIQSPFIKILIACLRERGQVFHMLFDFDVLWFNHSEIIFTLRLLFACFIFSLLFFFLLMSQKAHSPQTDLKRLFKVMELDHTLPWVGGKETGYTIQKTVSQVWWNFPKYQQVLKVRSRGMWFAFPERAKKMGFQHSRNSRGQGNNIRIWDQWIVALPHCKCCCR